MDKLDCLIPYEARRFMEEWNDASRPFIEAYTSGSTGIPKLIRLPKEMVRRSAQRSNDFFEITSDSRLHLALSAEYIAGKMLIVRAKEANSQITFEKPSQTPLATTTNFSPIHLLSLVGAQLPGFCRSMKSPKHPEVTHLLLGGAPLNMYQRQLACSGTWQPWESYGMTETASHIALRKVTLEGTEPFETLPGIKVSVDKEGALIIDMGPDGVFVTNDIVELLDDSHFRILGRRDNVIITGGHKVFPEQIENIIASAIPRGRKFYVSSQPSPQWGEELVLLVEGHPFTLPDFHRFPLLSFQIPRNVIFMEEIPSTPSGKIIRQKTKLFNEK